MYLQPTGLKDLGIEVYWKTKVEAFHNINHVNQFNVEANNNMYQQYQFAIRMLYVFIFLDKAEID